MWLCLYICKKVPCRTSIHPHYSNKNTDLKLMNRALGHQNPNMNRATGHWKLNLTCRALFRFCCILMLLLCSDEDASAVFSCFCCIQMQTIEHQPLSLFLQHLNGVQSSCTVPPHGGVKLTLTLIRPSRPVVCGWSPSQLQRPPSPKRIPYIQSDPNEPSNRPQLKPTHLVLLLLCFNEVQGSCNVAPTEA